MPRDSFGREIDYLRISLTDRCNLRCSYCMPMEGTPHASAEETLTAEEIGLVARAAGMAGFRKVRLTGGEPTLRPDLVEIVRRIRQVPQIADIALTTNGVLLPKLAAPLAAAGLDRVNIHIDTLDPDRLRRLMRLGAFEDIWRGIEAAEAAGLTPLKLNAVITRGYNDGDVADLARLTLTRNWHVRFIELMPLGTGETSAFSRAHYISNAETRARIEDSLGPLVELPGSSPGDESRNFRAADAAGVIGFISPVSEPYCGTCNRMRLTSDGKFHLCLLNDDELDVRSAIRRGADSGEIAAILSRAVQLKPTGHRLHTGQSTQVRLMVQIGG